MGDHVIGVDVGTGSAGAAVFDPGGRPPGTGTASIAIHNAPGDIYEQSADDIRRAGMDSGEDSLVALYVAGRGGICYGLRQILAAQRAAGIDPSRIVISGGAARSDLVRQLLADGTGLAVVAPETDEPVLPGASIPSAVAAGRFGSNREGMHAMSGVSRTYATSDRWRRVHDARLEIFEALQARARRARTGRLPGGAARRAKCPTSRGGTRRQSCRRDCRHASR